jgi:hypothetical protein
VKTRFRRLAWSIVVTLIVTTLTVSIASAATYYISENILYYISGPNNPPVTQSSGGCAGGQCKYLYQNSSSPSAYRWNWTQIDVIYWYVYVPTIGQAAARHSVVISGSPNWSINVNQANSSNQGKYVYLGYSDVVPNGGGYLMLHNGCVAGYWCGGLKVFWDNMKYIK